MEQNITTLYERVFDDEGNVKACGRKACQELMMALERFVGTSCDDKENGYMNIPAVKDAYRRYTNSLKDSTRMMQA